MTTAMRWSSEFTVAEHRDLQASAMAIDWTGVYLLLAGRRYLAIKKLDESSDTLYKVPRHSKYEVGAAEWNPSAANQELCAVSSNQRVEIWSCQPSGDLVHTHTLRSHTRVVTDLNWHKFDPNLVASSSIDTFIHIWDVRDQRRPALSLSAVAGASQVRWNRLSSYLLATAHDGDIKLWDQRKGTAPVQYIAAHLSKIHGLDWSPINENQLATSSQDCTVKFFDITNPRRAESIITTSSPVWRARYTPFGDGLVTVVVPQLRRGENSLLLWNRSNPSSPVYTFVGHTDVVLEFEWRKLKEDSTDYQLITWSKDQSLRIWTIEPFLQKLCGQGEEEDTSSIDDVPEPEEFPTNRFVVESTVKSPQQPLSLENGSKLEESLNGLTIEEAGKHISEATMISMASLADKDSSQQQSQPKTLQQEFSLININVLNIQLEAMDITRRSCTVTATRSGSVVILHVTFPPNYPFNAAPTFHFGQGTSLDNATMTKILKVVKQTALQRVRMNKSCLEPCLRQLVTTLDQAAFEDSELKTKLRTQNGSYYEPSNIYGSFQDAYIPFPRTSGAKFCSVGTLVCFGRPPFPRRQSTRLESPTPRSLSALGGNFTSFSLSGPNASGSVPFSHSQNPKTTRRSRSTHSTGRSVKSLSLGLSKSGGSRAIVTVYDASALFPISRELAEKYVLDHVDVPGMCQRNSALCASLGRRDLVQAWTLAALAASTHSQDSENEVPWPVHPFGRAMVESLIAFFVQQNDIQMAAMLCCTFGSRTENQDSFKNRQLSKSVNVSPGGSPYHTIHEVDKSLESWNYPIVKQNRSNSWSDSLDDFRFTSAIVEHREFTGASSADNSHKMLDDANAWLYDTYRIAYAEILHRWHLLAARAQVLKYMSAPPEPHKGVEFFTECQYCSKQVRGASCLFCKRLILQCAICHISVRGSSNFCLVCGHGGHTNHMMSWFETESVCPTGCGCNCLAECNSVLSP